MAFGMFGTGNLEPCLIESILIVRMRISSPSADTGEKLMEGLMVVSIVRFGAKELKFRAMLDHNLVCNARKDGGRLRSHSACHIEKAIDGILFVESYHHVLGSIENDTE